LKRQHRRLPRWRSRIVGAREFYKKNEYYSPSSFFFTWLACSDAEKPNCDDARHRRDRAPRLMRQLVLPLAPPPLPTLENFVPGRNTELLSVLSALVAGDRSERIVYLWGGRGCGKTHLLRALFSALEACNVSVAMLSGAGSQPEPHGNGAVLADDVEQLDDKGQEQLFSLYNTQRDGDGLLVAAGAVPCSRLSLRDDLATRLGWGLVYEVHPLSDEEKMDAMTEHARSRGFNLGREVMEYLLRRQARDLPGLLGLLDALDRFSLENKRAVTVPLVRELLSGSSE
jgi:DnaA-homolog protein